MYLDDRGSSIALGNRLGSEGFEGATYTVIGQPDVAAKIYHPHRFPDEELCEKLRFQIATQIHSIRKIAAWPEKLLFVQGKVVGFTMRKIPGKSIHLLYRPDDRNIHFPNATWQSLIDVARNVAAAFHCLHQNGVLMGDVNQSNIFVLPNTGEVRFIDCDSYQVEASANKVFRCSVFTSEWAAPELMASMKSPAKDLNRTVQHDRFGLAVMIFHLLFMGKHPFAGVPPGHLLENAPSLEDLIQQSIFPYSRIKRGGFEPPPNFLSLQALPEFLASLFEKAFLSRDRPSANDWCQALENIPFKKCQWGHVYYRVLPDCPWCAVWNRGGGNFFVVLPVGDDSGSTLREVEKLLQEVESSKCNFPEHSWNASNEVRFPFFSVPNSTTLTFSSPAATPFPKIAKARVAFIVGVVLILPSIFLLLIAPTLIGLWLTALFVGLMLLVPGTANPAYNVEIKRRMEAPAHWMNLINIAIRQMRELANRSAKEFDQECKSATQRVTTALQNEEQKFNTSRKELHQSLKLLRDECRQMTPMRNSLRRLLAEKAQLEMYLRNMRVPSQGIPQIGPVRYKTLVSYGIFTAWDVRTMGSIPGLGAGAAELVNWVRGKESQFKFKPSDPLPTSAEQEVRKKMLQKEQEILKQFQKLWQQWLACQKMGSPEQLRRLASEAVSKELYSLQDRITKATVSYQKFIKDLAQSMEQYAQALADSKTCPKPINKWY